MELSLQEWQAQTGRIEVGPLGTVHRKVEGGQLLGRRRRDRAGGCPKLSYRRSAWIIRTSTRKSCTLPRAAVRKGAFASNK